MIPSLLLTILLIWNVTSAYNWSTLDNAVQQAINEGIFYGCAIGVATSTDIIIQKAYGTIGPKRGLYSPPVTMSMQFDLGHLTGPVGINAVLMEQWDKSMIITTNKISYLYSPFNNNDKKYITVQNLLEHNSGTHHTI